MRCGVCWCVCTDDDGSADAATAALAKFLINQFAQQFSAVNIILGWRNYTAFGFLAQLLAANVSLHCDDARLGCTEAENECAHAHRTSHIARSRYVDIASVVVVVALRCGVMLAA